jgi:hypothetical protein
MIDLFFKLSGVSPLVVHDPAEALSVWLPLYGRSNKASAPPFFLFSASGFSEFRAIEVVAVWRVKMAEAFESVFRSRGCHATPSIGSAKWRGCGSAVARLPFVLLKERRSEAGLALRS